MLPDVDELLDILMSLEYVLLVFALAPAHSRGRPQENTTLPITKFWKTPSLGNSSTIGISRHSVSRLRSQSLEAIASAILAVDPLVPAHATRLLGRSAFWWAAYKG
jgi:hypothetical protein